MSEEEKRFMQDFKAAFENLLSENKKLKSTILVVQRLALEALDKKDKDETLEQIADLIAVVG